MNKLGPVRVVIADDSPAARQLLRLWLAPEHGFSIVGEAPDGKTCVELAGALRPDIIVMDVDMPVMDGIEATRQIMARVPTPILIHTSRAVAKKHNVAFKALEAGAVDLRHKADDAASNAEAEEFRALLRVLAPIKVIRRNFPRAEYPARVKPGKVLASLPRILAVGSSTGGPLALVSVLSALPALNPLCTLVVQHMSEDFMAGFAEWLAGKTDLPVKIAAHGNALRPGVVMVAPGDQHMRLGPDGLLRMDRSEPLHACRPSVDALFHSVAETAGPKSIGLLLTGMGVDGAEGLLHMKNCGATTVAQDEASSVIYGMPKAAVELGAADHVLPLKDIGAFLAELSRAEGSR